MKLDTYVVDTSPVPIKTTTTTDTTHNANFFSEVSNTTPADEKEGKMTAVAAVMTCARETSEQTPMTSANVRSKKGNKKMKDLTSDSHTAVRMEHCGYMIR